MRRSAPRPLAVALEGVTRGGEPGTLLARVQSHWREVAGDVVADEAQPLSEREGRVTVECRSAVWAQELALLAPELVGRLNERLGAPSAVRSLRFVTGVRDPA